MDFCHPPSFSSKNVQAKVKKNTSTCFDLKIVKTHADEFLKKKLESGNPPPNPPPPTIPEKFPTLTEKWEGKGTSFRQTGILT